MMENVFNISTSFILLGMVEMEHSRYFYSVLCILTYSITVLSSLVISGVIWSEETLHEPMYILIGCLVLNGVLGSSSILPKLTSDLLTSSNRITRTGCFIQAFCVVAFPVFEITIFTIMAYDTYLAICHPLQYANLMTKVTVIKLIIGCLTFSFIAVSISLLLSARFPFCGNEISGILCDSLALLVLSCVDNSVNNVYGTVLFSGYVGFCIVLIFHSYLRISLICLTMSKQFYKKALHTLVTHLLNFSIFLVGVFFAFLRYRVGNGISLGFQLFLAFTTLVLPPLINPLIYGIRTKKLKPKIMCHLQKINKGQNMEIPFRQ